MSEVFKKKDKKAQVVRLDVDSRSDSSYAMYVKVNFISELYIIAGRYDILSALESNLIQKTQNLRNRRVGLLRIV